MKYIDRGQQTETKHVTCSRVSDEEGLYKPVPPPKPVPNNQKNQNGQESSRVQTVVEQSSRPISGIERNITLDDNQVRSSGQNPAPEYRMPPLYGEEQSSNQTQQAANLQTHSSKFPVSLFQAIRICTCSIIVVINLRQRFEQPTKRFVRRREQDQEPCKNNTSIGRIT